MSAIATELKVRKLHSDFAIEIDERIDTLLDDSDAIEQIRQLWQTSPLIIFPRQMAPPLYDHFLQTCRDAGYLPAAIVHARNPHFTHGLILAGRGVHFNEEPWTELPAGIVWRPLHGGPLAWRTSALWLKSRHSAETDAFTAAVSAGLRAGGHR